MVSTQLANIFQLLLGSKKTPHFSAASPCERECIRSALLIPVVYKAVVCTNNRITVGRICLRMGYPKNPMVYHGLSWSIMTFPHSTCRYWGIPHWTIPFAYWSLISYSCFHIFIDAYFIGKLHASLMLLPISAGDSDLGSFGLLGLGAIFRSFQVAACERWQSKPFICQKSSGWWLTYPSEKWWSSSVGMMTFPIITLW